MGQVIEQVIEDGRMKNDPRMTFLAVVAAAAVLASAAPVTAAEHAATDVSAKVASATRQVPARIAMPRYVRPATGQLDCAGTWCRRHFVLMIGIGY
jgi:hypothetical protein